MLTFVLELCKESEMLTNLVLDTHIKFLEAITCH